RARAVDAGEAFDSGDGSARALADADDARADLLAVEQHRARAAVSRVAADLGSGQAELVAQRVGEAARRIAGELARAAVDVEADDLDRGEVGRGHFMLATMLKARHRCVWVASIR